MTELEAPKTPTPASRTLRKSDNVGSANHSAVITPPPSDKKTRTSFASRHVREPTSPSKTFPTIMAKAASRPGSFGSAMPSSEQIQNMNVDQLRDLTNGLIPSLGEARMELAHTKLQYQLLSIETREAAERAEVEHDMTRKEVEVLQAGSPILQGRAVITPDPRSTLAQMQHQLEAAVLHNHELETNNAALDRRLKDAKRVIKYLDGRNLELDDSNKMLRERIRDNREHLNAMRSSGLLRSAPSSPKQSSHNQHAPAASHSINHYATPARPRRLEFQHTPATPTARMTSAVTPRSSRPHDDAFGTLLFASAVLDDQQQRASVPSTPSPTRAMRQPPTHTRGTLSMSSLPVTPKTLRFQQDHLPYPASSRPVSAAVPTGVSGFASHRRSVSTISDSSQDERTPAVIDDDLPASQASQAASDLLRKYPGPSSQERPSSGLGLGLIQTKLTGKIIKGNKRRHDEGKGESPKKQKTAAQVKGDVGLGIGVGIRDWPARR